MSSAERFLQGGTSQALLARLALKIEKSKINLCFFSSSCLLSVASFDTSDQKYLRRDPLLSHIT